MPNALLCVYYKVGAGQHAQVALRVRQMQAELAGQWPGLACELLQRPEAVDGVQTWMETYRQVDGLGPELIAAIAGAALAARLPTPRHAEHFVPMP